MHLTIIFFNCTLYYIGKVNITGENFFSVGLQTGRWSRFGLVQVKISQFFFLSKTFFFSHLANLPGGCVAERVARDACGRWMCRQQVWLLGTPVWTRSSLRCTICSPRVGKWWLLPAGLLARKNFPTGPHQRRQLILSKILLPKKFSPNYYF